MIQIPSCHHMHYKDYNVQYIGLGNYQMQSCVRILNLTIPITTIHIIQLDNSIWRTDVIFEIWGGGGGGAVSCCCSHRRHPGGAGAYAYKRLTGNEVVAGCKYQICIAASSCRTTSKSGRRGCKTYITGHNLSNFCAEGGHGGCSFCFEQGCYWLTHRRNESGCTMVAVQFTMVLTGGSVGLPGALESRCYGEQMLQQAVLPISWWTGKF